MNAIEQLEQDHRDVEDLFDRLDVTDDPDRRRALREEIGTLLAVHALVEEEHFYPAVRQEDTQALLVAFLKVHDDVKRLTARLLRADPADDELFCLAAQRLRLAFDRHVREEEALLFPKARELLGPDTLRALGQDMQATRETHEEIEPREYLDPENAPTGPFL